MTISTFTGGIFDTNCFLCEEHGILIDAPQGAAQWIAQRGAKVNILILTHGHIDHVVDAAAIHREHQCEVECHAETVPMITDPAFFRRLGFQWDVESVQPTRILDEAKNTAFGSLTWDVLHVPGHCPGSLCFFDSTEKTVFGGDVLFAGGVGRWDLPGGDRDLLFSGIKTKLFPLGDDVRVLPGHGPATTIGRERKTNPYLAD